MFVDLIQRKTVAFERKLGSPIVEILDELKVKVQAHGREIGPLFFLLFIYFFLDYYSIIICL
jgi:hypothetical protein